MAEPELSVLLKLKDEATSGLKKFGKVAGGALAGLGVAAIGMGVASMKMAADFEGSMREVNTMLNLSEGDFASLNDQVNNLSKEVGISGGELAGALYQAVSAGVPAAQAMDTLKIAAQAAVGGVTDTETAMDGLTTVMNAFKIPATDAGHIADVMFTTVKGGKTTMEELSASMFNVAPLAAAAGIQFEEVSAAIATVTKQGVPTTVATTQLRAAIQAMIKPTADMKTMLDSLGYSSGSAMIQEQGLAGSLNILSGATEGNQELLGKMFGSVEGLGAVLGLTGANAETFAGDLASVQDAAGSSMAAYDEINKGTGRTFEKLKVQLEAVMVQLGTGLLPLLTPLTDAFEKLISSLPIDEISQLLSELLPPLIDIIVDLMNVIPVDMALKFVTSVLKPTITLLQAIMTIVHPLLTLLEPIFLILTKVMEILTPVIEGLAWVIENFVGGPVGAITSWIGEGIGALFGGASGAIVTKPTLSMIGENGPEALIPLSGAPGASPLGGGGPVYVTVNVAGSVIAERDLAETVRRELLLLKNRNYSTGLA